MKKFWNFTSKDGERQLDINGVIADETWWGDEVTPAEFKEELDNGSGAIRVCINSPGGDCFAAAQIYNMLKAYNGKVRVFIDSLAASAASVIAMAGDEVEISPVGMLMIHNPSTVAYGDHRSMEQAVAVLEEVKSSIINAYAAKTGKSRSELSELMEAETWFSAQKALDYGFVDKISGEENTPPEAYLFSTRAHDSAVYQKVCAMYQPGDPEEPEKPEEDSVPDDTTAPAEPAETSEPDEGTQPEQAPNETQPESEPTVTDSGHKVSELYARLEALRKVI